MNIETIAKAIIAASEARLAAGEKVYRLRHVASGKYVGRNYNLVGRASALTKFSASDVSDWMYGKPIGTESDEFVTEEVQRRKR